MLELLRGYYERFRGLSETTRLLLVVTMLGVCSLYFLGLLSIIAAPRLRQAPIAYAEAAIVAPPTATPTDVPPPTATATATPTPTEPPLPTATPSVTQTLEPTPTQQRVAIAPPTSSPPPTTTKRATSQTVKTATAIKRVGSATATPTRTRTASRR